MRDNQKRKMSRPGPSNSRPTPETPLRGKGLQASQDDEDEDDEMESSHRRLPSHGLPRLEDLFREDTEDNMDVDLNLGTFDNGRRDNDVRQYVRFG
jgi:hypothetical protein